VRVHDLTARIGGLDTAVLRLRYLGPLSCGDGGLPRLLLGAQLALESFDELAALIGRGLQ